MSFKGTPETVVTVAGSPTTNGSAATTFAQIAGSNRNISIVARHEQSSVILLSTLALNGVAASRVASANTANSSGTRGMVEVWEIKEVDYAAVGDNPELTVTLPSGTAVVQCTIFQADGVDQAATRTQNSGADTNAVAISFELDSVAGSHVVGGMICTSGTGFSISADVTETAGSDGSFNSGASFGVAFSGIASDTSTTVTGDNGSTSTSAYQAMVAVGFPPASEAAAPDLSTPTPSGTLATQGQATIGATTDQASGTFYTVVTSNASQLTGITAAEIVAGQIAGGGAAPYSGNAAVTDTSPDVTVTGLPAETTLYSASVQVNANGTSDIVTTSFTTATASRSVTVTLSSRTTGALAGRTLRFFTRQTLHGAAVDGGTDGLEFTANGSGVFAITGLTIAAGAGFLTTLDDLDSTFSVNLPVTFVAGL